MLIYSMGVSVDGFISDREGEFGRTAPDEELFGFHLARVRELGGYLCGRRLYETILVWETDPSMRDDELSAEFADAWGSTDRRRWRHAVPTAGDRGRPAEPDRDQGVPLSGDLRALRARPLSPTLTAR